MKHVLWEVTTGRLVDRHMFQSNLLPPSSDKR